MFTAHCTGDALLELDKEAEQARRPKPDFIALSDFIINNNEAIANDTLTYEQRAEYRRLTLAAYSTVK